MSNLKQITSEIDELFRFKDLTGAYEEIASMKMRRIRGTVLFNRDFIYALAEIYREVSVSNRNELLRLIKEKKKTNDFALRPHNGKTAVIFLSANSGLFGAILKNAYQEFIKYIDSHPGEPIIVGEFGKKMFEAQFPSRKFTFFPLQGDSINPETLKIVTNSLMQFENVIIFYAHFNSMASQGVAMLDVAGEETPMLQKEILSANYAFEPSMGKILEFFEQEIFANIMEQNFTESELARHAARIIALDTATKNIDVRLKKIDLEHRVAIHRILNKKQTEALGGMMLWNIK